MPSVQALEGFRDAKYVSLVTTKRDGSTVSTPVWIARVGDELGIITDAEAGKVKRIRNTPSVTLVVCDARGVVSPGAHRADGTARLVTSGDALTVRRAIARRYGLVYRLFAVTWAVRDLTSRIRRQAQSPETAILISLPTE